MDADAVHPMGAAAVGLGALWGAGLGLWGEAVPSTGPWPRGDGCDMEEDNRSATCLGAGQVEPPRALPTQRIPGALQLYFLSSVSGPPQTLVPIQHALGRRCAPGEPREGVGSAVCGELIPAFTMEIIVISVSGDVQAEGVWGLLVGGSILHPQGGLTVPHPMLLC